MTRFFSQSRRYMYDPILNTRTYTYPFSVFCSKSEKPNNGKCINNVIYEPISRPISFFSDVAIDYWLWTVKAWKISPITWQSPCWNVPVLAWSQKLFPGWGRSFDNMAKISCLFTLFYLLEKDKQSFDIYTPAPLILLSNPPHMYSFLNDSVIENHTYYLLLYSQFPKRWW